MDNKKFKYDIIHKTKINTYEKLPKFFLADNPIEAENLYAKFKKLLNNMAYSYAITTGIPKSDLFGEALLGLARANCDWDDKRSDNFKSYVIFRVKDALNEYVRRNAQIITIPSYIKKANALLNRIKSLLERFEISTDDIYTIIIIANVDNTKIPDDQKEICKKMLNRLVAAAIRANVDYDKFIRRIEYLPIDIDINESIEQESQKEKEKKFRAVIMVEKLKNQMNKNELFICNEIMNGLTYKEIGKKFGKSDAWISNQLKKLRRKLLNRISTNYEKEKNQ